MLYVYMVSLLWSTSVLCEGICLCLPVDRNVDATIEQRQQLLV